jgi:peptidoglycan/LPS O-acetylase OafA/YrhL
MSQRNIPSLDGLRAISVSLVVLGHLGGTRNFPRLPEFVTYYANFGVRVFFVMSGFLITSILLKEQARSGTISLKDFYLRRAFRIFPAAYGYIIAVCAIAGIGLHHFAMAGLYVSNYDYSRPWLLGHLWSLAVEEQFYLLWPLALVLFFARRKTIAIAVICIAPLLRTAYFFGLGSSLGQQYIGFSFPTVADALATGCLLAIGYEEFASVAERLGRWVVLVPVATVLIPMMPQFLTTRGYNLLGITLMNFGIAVSIQNAIEKRYRVLNWRPVVWVGVLSYSLYLWQAPFLNRYSKGAWAAFPLNLVLAFVFAAGSYYLIERPFLAIRNRVHDRRETAVASGLISPEARTFPQL